jgi:hypothetical protein
VRQCSYGYRQREDTAELSVILTRVTGVMTRLGSPLRIKLEEIRNLFTGVQFGRIVHQASIFMRVLKADQVQLCPNCGQLAHGKIDCETINLVLGMDNERFAELNHWIGIFFPGTTLKRVKVDLKVKNHG